MYIHFKGQGHDVSINMDQVKEIQYDIIKMMRDSEKRLFTIRIVMKYPQNIGGAVTGMFHFDFFFNDEEERNKCKTEINSWLMSFAKNDYLAHIKLPEIEGK